MHLSVRRRQNTFGKRVCGYGERRCALGNGDTIMERTVQIRIDEGSEPLQKATPRRKPQIYSPSKVSVPFPCTTPLFSSSILSVQPFKYPLNIVSPIPHIR